MFAIFSNPRVTEFHNLDTFAHLNEASQVIEKRAASFASGRGIRWGIVYKRDDRITGSCGFTWND